MKNIEINYMNESGYEVLYPKTNLEQIEGFQEFREGIYNKEEVDGIIDSLRGQTGNLKFAMGSYTGTAQIKSAVQNQINIGFKPTFVFISYAEYEGTGPVFTWSQLGGESNRLLSGFGSRYFTNNQEGLNVTENGFWVKNIDGNISGVYTRIWLNEINIVYNYIAFG